MGIAWLGLSNLLISCYLQHKQSESLAELKLDIERLPLISITDAAIRELAKDGKQVTPGDVIRVERNSTAAGRGFRYYRKVVA